MELCFLISVGNLHCAWEYSQILDSAAVVKMPLFHYKMF